MSFCFKQTPTRCNSDDPRLYRGEEERLLGNHYFPLQISLPIISPRVMAPRFLIIRSWKRPEICNPRLVTLPRRSYFVYIVASISGTLYIGISGNLHRRVFQHKFHHFEGFTDRYDVERLLYWESYDDVHRALGREKQLKGWTRAKKVALIVRRNPHWIDLASEWYPWMSDKDRVG